MYRKRMHMELGQWVERGLLPAEIGRRLAQDLDDRPDSFSMGRVLIMLAAGFMASALLLFLSSNWEAIPRIVRLCGVVALIWGFHLAGAAALGRGRTGLAAAGLLLGTAAFGGGLSLAGQMYHIDGDLSAMMAVWFGAATLSAVVFRSAAVAVAAGLLAFAVCWSLLAQADWTFSLVSAVVAPLLGVVMAGLGRWTGEKNLLQFTFLLLQWWFAWLCVEIGGPFAAVACLLLGTLLLVAVSLPSSPLSAWAQRLGGAPAFHALLLAAIGTFFLHVALDDGPQIMLAAVAGLLCAVMALAVAGRDHGGVRWLAYGMIASIVFYVWANTVGSILGTSGFFLMASLVAAALALLVTRLEKRFTEKAGGAA